MTHFRFRQMFFFLMPAPNLAKMKHTKLYDKLCKTLKWTTPTQLKQMSDRTWRAAIPSISGVFTWHTMFSSIQRTVMGTLAPHLSQSALIPHLTAITPVLLELGVITPGLGSMIRGCTPMMSDSLNSETALKLLNWVVIVVVGALVGTLRLIDKSRRL